MFEKFADYDQTFLPLLLTYRLPTSLTFFHSGKNATMAFDILDCNETS